MLISIKSEENFCLIVTMLLNGLNVFTILLLTEREIFTLQIFCKIMRSVKIMLYLTMVAISA